MRRTIVIVENLSVDEEPWITPEGLFTKELECVLDFIKKGRAGNTAYERHVSENGTIVTLMTDTRSQDNDSLVAVPYSQESAYEQFLDKDGQ